MIKFGKLAFSVKELGNEEEGLERVSFHWKKQCIISENMEKNDEICRICYAGTMENELLISPCQCQGSLKYVHLNCLKYWMKNRAIFHETSYGKAYFWKSLDCELCHTQLPGLLLEKR